MVDASTRHLLWYVYHDETQRCVGSPDSGLLACSVRGSGNVLKVARDICVGQVVAARTCCRCHEAYECDCTGKEGSMSSLKSRMAALKKGMGIGNSDVKGTRLAAAAAATDAGAIQHRLASIIQVRIVTFRISLLNENISHGTMRCIWLLEHTMKERSKVEQNRVMWQAATTSNGCFSNDCSLKACLSLVLCRTLVNRHKYRLSHHPHILQSISS